VYDEVAHLSLNRNFFYKVFYKIVGIKLINAKPALDGAVNVVGIDGFSHSLHALSNQLLLFHKASSKGAFLNSRTWTTNIQIKLIIPPLLGNQGCLCQQIGITASELYNYGVFNLIVCQVIIRTMQNSVIVDHFCIECGLFTD
jgi:hypothetical protein